MSGDHLLIVTAVLRRFILGDSVAFGWGLKDDETIGARMERIWSPVPQDDGGFRVASFVLLGASCTRD